MWAHPTDESDGGASGWPTPISSSGGPGKNPENQRGVQQGNPLATAAGTWPTPRVSAANGSSQKEVAAGNPKKRLETEAEMGNWPTARSRDWKGSGTTVIRKDGKSRMDQLDYAAEQSQFGHQALAIQMDGSESSENDQTSPQPSPKRLNPSFVEWLMGVPVGWTSLKPLATESYQQFWQSFYIGY